MATKAKPRKKAPDILDEVKTGDVQDLVNHVKTYPVWYAGAVIFLIVCVAIGVVYRSSGSSDVQAETTTLARALENEDPLLRADELKPIAEGNGPKADEAQYHLGHAYLSAKKYSEAKEAFEAVRGRSANSPFLPGAVEGLGLVAENEKDYEGALKYYNEVVEKWPDSLVRRRQGLHIARVQEQLGKFDEAVKAYQNVEEKFPAYGQEAQKALGRLEKSHPDLFPKTEDVSTGEAKQSADAASLTEKPAE